LLLSDDFLLGLLLKHLMSMLRLWQLVYDRVSGFLDHIIDPNYP